MSQYNPYAEYKESGVAWLGKMPSHWSLTPIKRFARVENGRDYTDVYQENGAIPIYGSGGQFSTASAPLYSGESVLIGRKGTLDKPLHVNGPFWTVDTVFYTRLFDSIHGRYLYYCVLNFPFSLYSTNTALPSLTQSAISEHKLSAAPLPEQQAIANFPDRETERIDALIQKKSKFIELLEEKRQALISHAVTKGLNPDAPMKDSGVPWLREVPAHWTRCRLSFRFQTNLGKMLDARQNIGKHPVPYLRNQDVQWRRININDLPNIDIALDERERYTVKYGDMLVCEGGDVGRSAIWRNESRVGFQKALHRVRPRNTNSDSNEFLLFAMEAAKNCGAFDSDDSKATISHLTGEQLDRFQFAFPPITEQNQIVERLGSATSLIFSMSTSVRNSIALLREKRSALITAAVTGQIDVREEVVG